MAQCLHPICVQGYLIPCGKCPECRQKVRKQMATRILLESQIENCATYFLTLTYDDEHLPLYQGENCFSKDDVNKFLDNLRYRFEKYALGKFRYFLTCEYGEHGSRSHYHAILLCKDIDQYLTPISELRIIVDDAWRKGRTQLELANEARINYCTQYALKENAYQYKLYEPDDPRKPFRLFSRNPGICGTKSCVEYMSKYIENDSNPKNMRWSIDTGNGSCNIPRYIIGKCSELVRTSASEKGKQYLLDHQDEMLETKIRNGSIQYIILDDGSKIEDSIKNDYSVDRNIIARRKAIRELRAKNLDNQTL